MSNSFLFRARSQIYPLFSSNRLENRTNHRDFIHRFSWKTWLVGCAWDTHTYSWLSTPTWVWNRSRFRRGAIRSTDFTNESDDNSELKEEGKEKKNREWTRQERERIRVNVIIVAHTTIKSKSGISLLIGFLNRFKYKEIGIFLLYALMTGNSGGLTTTAGKHVFYTGRSRVKVEKFRE